MLYLPDFTGRFPVGAITFKLPVYNKVLGTASISGRHGHHDELKPALQLNEVVFTAYYPADVKESDLKNFGLHWLLRLPVHCKHLYRDTLTSQAGLTLLLYRNECWTECNLPGIPLWLVWPIIYLYGALLKIPVYPNAPLLSRRSRTVDSSWPLVIFSHGLGGSRTAYSQLCSRLASSGRVVLAMQHCDGSGHAFISSTTGPGFYIQESDLIWTSETNDDDKTMDTFRQQQLDFRRLEIYLAFDSFKQLIQDGYRGSNHGLRTIDGESINWSSWSSDGNSKTVECDKDVLLAGHSFGGATVASEACLNSVQGLTLAEQFTILSTDPPADVCAPIPVHKALILDPWLEPIPSPGPCPPPHGPDDALPQLLVINSEKFSLWKDHFARLIGVVQAWEPEKRRVLTIIRSQHTSFSDFAHLPLFARRDSRILMDRIVEISEVFIDGDLDAFVNKHAIRKMEICVVGKKSDGSPQRQIVGDAGDIIAHCSTEL